MKKQKGFSLIELLISLFIVGVIFLVYNASVNTVYLNGNAKNQELALRIASNELEALRATPFASLPASGGFSNALLSLLPGSQAQLQVISFNSHTQEVTATVSWQDRYSNMGRTISLTTLITQGGL